jgi:hypothetical protein
MDHPFRGDGVTEYKIRSESVSLFWNRWNCRSILEIGLAAIFSVAGLLVFIPYFEKNGSFAGDWNNVFHPALHLFLAGKSPFSLPMFFCPPWILILLSPLALLPRPFDWLVLVVVTFCCFGLTARRMGAKTPVMILLMTLPQFLWGVLYGNIDGLISLGLILPPQIGLLFVLIKPQIGLPVALFWFIAAWQKGKLKEVIRVFWPVTVLTLLSFLLYGLWPFQMRTPVDEYWNIAYFPYLIPVGVILLIRSIRQKNLNGSILAGPFLSPYIGIQSLPQAVLGLLPAQMDTLAAIVSLWVVWILRGPF